MNIPLSINRASRAVGCLVAVGSALLGGLVAPPLWAQSPAGPAAAPGLGNPAEAQLLCRLIEDAPHARELSRITPVTGTNSQAYGTRDGKALAMRSVSCERRDPRDRDHMLELSVLIAADARVFAEAERDMRLAAADATDFKQVESLKWRGGECSVGEYTFPDGSGQGAARRSWGVSCESTKGLRFVQLAYSHPSRSGLPKLSAVKAHFDGVMARL